jgi:acetyl-CoA acetyltransferase
MSQRPLIAGVGMIPFVKPGANDPYPVMAGQATHLALADAGVTYDQIQHAYVGYVYGDSTCGQRALYELGMTGIPIFNVNNNCSTGSTALYLARQAVESGVVECALALGFEQMAPGALDYAFADRPAPLERFTHEAELAYPGQKAPMAIQLFGGAGLEYQDKYGTRNETFARISEKARRHATYNERAIFRKPVSVEEVLASPLMFGNLTRLQCCPPTCGAAAAVVVSEAYARKHGIAAGVAIVAQALTTDYCSTFDDHSMIKVVGYEMSRAAAQQVYNRSGIGPEEVDVVELHDCFTVNELISYEALGLCPEGGAEQFVWDDANTYGGQVVTNPSGGLLAKGHPLGATGLAQCAELVWQLRGQAGPRQVEDAKVALQHNIGLGGACVVTMYQRVDA